MVIIKKEYYDKLRQFDSLDVQTRFLWIIIEYGLYGYIPSDLSDDEYDFLIPIFVDIDNNNN